MDNQLLVFVLGPPGAGKGTQCELARQQLGWSHIPAGDLLRAEVQAGSDIGLQAQQYMRDGKMVPASMMVGLLRQRLESGDHAKLLIDGFPRQLDQLQEWQQQVGKYDKVIAYKVPEEVAMERLFKRAESSGREDDNNETIRKRFVVYLEETIPVINALRAHGKVTEINATGSPEEVLQATKQVLIGLEQQYQQASQQAQQQEKQQQPEQVQQLLNEQQLQQQLQLLQLARTPIAPVDVPELPAAGDAPGLSAEEAATAAAVSSLGLLSTLGGITDAAAAAGAARITAGLAAMPAGLTLLPNPTTPLQPLQDSSTTAAAVTDAPGLVSPVAGSSPLIAQLAAVSTPASDPIAVAAGILLPPSGTVAPEPLSLATKDLSQVVGLTSVTVAAEAAIPRAVQSSVAANASVPAAAATAAASRAAGLDAVAGLSAATPTASAPKSATVMGLRMDLSGIRTPIVICGPSGVGKGTLISKLMAQYPDRFGFSVSHTTRAPRLGEQHGVHYYFTDKASMQAQVSAGMFLEHADVHGNMYGTSLAAVARVSQEGKHCVLDIDVQGAQQVRHSALGSLCLFIFIAPPSHEELERRLRNRGTETEDKVLQRLANAKSELAKAQEPDLFNHMLVNGDLELAYYQLQLLIEQHVPGLLPELQTAQPPQPAAAGAATAPASSSAGIQPLVGALPGSSNQAVNAAAALPAATAAAAVSHAGAVSPSTLLDNAAAAATTSTLAVAAAPGSAAGAGNVLANGNLTDVHVQQLGLPAAAGASGVQGLGLAALTANAKGMPVRQYMDATVIPVLREGLKSLNAARPDDPLQYLAEFLIAHKHAAR